MHRVKAMVVAGMTALVVSGLLAGGAGASVVMNPSAQEAAEHPNMGYEVHCQMTSEESTNSTHADMERFNAEGRCTSFWMKEPPAVLRLERDEAAQASGTKAKFQMKAKKHHRRHAAKS